MKRAVVTVLFNEEAKVLLLKRTSDHEHFPDQWCLPGGKIDIVEESAVCPRRRQEGFASNMTGELKYRLEFPEETAYRETFEETGIKLRNFVKTEAVLCDGKFLVYAFVSKSMHMTDELNVNFPNREHAECKFFLPGELPELGGITKAAINNAVRAIKS